jgi:hypothetical protein
MYMKILVIIITILGIFEIISNLFHLSKMNKDAIGQSAKRQHQELSLLLPDIHFYIKAIIMFVFGWLFFASGIVYFIFDDETLLGAVLFLFGLYGLLQALYYKRPYKVWMSLIVYFLPIVVFVLEELPLL